MNDGTAAKNVDERAIVMIVEDDALIAMDLALQIEELGFVVSGPFHDVTSALEAIEQSVPDAALLDFNLNRNETSKVIAERLTASGVPVTFLSGYSATDLLAREGLEEHMMLSKPVTAIGLKDSIVKMLSVD